MSFIRKTVSKKKRRYQKNGFDLDLSYITDNLIAMGFPSESVEGVYRNPFKEVFRFLEQMHKDRYKVYNLCSERGYDVSKFHNRVECFPFDDHNCPPLELIFKFCKNVKDWLGSHEKNVAVIHCKAGKGRTGLMICSYMLYSGEWKQTQDALDFYAAMRTYNKKGVTIPSQIRYVGYCGEIVGNKLSLPEPRPLLLTSIELSPPPKLPKLTDVRFSVYVNKTLIYTFKDTPILKNQQNKKKKKSKAEAVTEDENVLEETLCFECPAPVPCVGDIKLDFYEKETFGSDRLFAFWFNTAFVDPETNTLEIKKDMLDKANKDKSHKLYRENYRVTCIFSPLEVDAKQLLSNQTAQGSSKPATDVLNGAKTFTSATKRSACEVSEDLLKQAIEVSMNDSSSVLSTIDHFKNVRDSNAFKAFAISTCELQDVVVNELSHEERLSFWINIYNTLAIHANVLFASDESNLETKLKLSKKAKYNIGGLVYSLADIEFCVLRNKMTIPDQYEVKKFDAIDLRPLCSLSKAEPRLNFVLNNGTASGPLVQIFHADIIFEELEKATRLYLQERVSVDAEKKAILLPKTLEWFYADFAKTPEKAIKELSNYLTADQKKAVSECEKVAFKDYDWRNFYSFKHFTKEEDV